MRTFYYSYNTEMDHQQQARQTRPPVVLASLPNGSNAVVVYPRAVSTANATTPSIIINRLPMGISCLFDYMYKAAKSKGESL